MATTHRDSPGTGMRVGPFVLDVAAMGSRRRGRGAPADAPVEVPEPAAVPESSADVPSAPAGPALSFLERRALLEAERQYDDDSVVEIPDEVEDEIRGVLDDVGDGVAAPDDEKRPARELEPAGSPRRTEPVRPSPATRANVPAAFPRRDVGAPRSPLTPRAETRSAREIGRFPSAPNSRPVAPARREPTAARGPSTTRSSGTYRAAGMVRPASSRSEATTRQNDAVRTPSSRPVGGSASGAPARPTTVGRSATPSRGGYDASAVTRSVPTVPRVARPPSGRYAVARPSTATGRRAATVRDEADAPPPRPSAGPGARDWTPARNVRDAQARVAAARASGGRTAAASAPVAPPTYTPRAPQYDLRVRVAIMADREACAAIETTYTTDSVWQLDARQDDNEIRIGLRQISLPKPMAATESMDVPFVNQTDALWLVAEELEVPPSGRETTEPTVGTVVGFLTATIEPRREMVYLSAVAVDPDYRRQHLGSALIEHMRRWAAREGVPEITADVSAKNAPALRLLQRNGFRFCGYSDRLYRNGEVALFLATAVR